MSFFSNVMNRIRFGDDEYDEYDDYEGYDDEEVEEAPKNVTRTAQRASAQTQTSEKTRIFTRPKQQSQSSAKSNGMQLVLVKPTGFEDVRDICDPLLSGKAVVINMEGMHSDIIRRIIDFTSGSTYSIKGNLQKISNYIVIATPPSIELSGEFADMISNAYDMQGFNLRI